MQKTPKRIPAAMPSKHLRLIFIVLVILLIIPIVFTVSKLFTKSKTSTDVISDKSFNGYAQFAKENGTKKAYLRLKEQYQKNDPQAHDFAHVIGISAYEQLGPQGLAICDTAYNYGCYHGFIEAFLVEKGTPAIVEIEKGCLALGSVHAPSCLHGIGHGVLAGRAYKMNEALKDCDIMQEANRIFCWDGVFMERVTGSMQNPKDRFNLTSSNLLEPCDKIAKIYKGQCWRNQVTSWLIYFKNDTKEVGKMCQKIEMEHQPTCFESIGLANVMFAGEDQTRLLTLCKILPNENYSDQCLMGELKEILFEGKSSTLARSLCDYVEGSRMQECIALFNQHYQDSRLRFGS